MARSRWGSAPSRLPARHAACNSRSIATRLDCRRRAGLRREGPVPLFGLARLSTKRENGKPRGQDWQTWSAAMYLYATECVATGRTPFFDEIRDA